MSRAARRFLAGLTTLTGTAAGASAVLALLVFATVFVATATPRQSVLYRTKALQQVFASVPVTGQSVNASMYYTALSDVLGSQGSPLNHIDTRQIDRAGAEIAGHLVAAGLPLQPASAWWSGVTSTYAVVTAAARSARYGGVPPRVQILYRNALGRFSAIAAGRMPAISSVTSNSAKFQVAVTAATAARFSLRPGSVLRIGTRLTLIVSGILTPASPGSSFWNADLGVATPTLYMPPEGNGVGYWLGSVFISGSELANAESAIKTSDLTLTWEYPLALGGINANQAGALNNGLINASAQAGVLSTNSFSAGIAAISSGVSGQLTQFVQTDGQVGSLLSLLQVSLAIVGAIVLLFGCRLLAERRAAEFGLMRARGAGRLQLGLLAFRAGLLAVVPAVAVAVITAVALTPGGDDPLAWWLAGLTTFVALTGVPVLAVRSARGGGQPGERADTPPPRLVRVRRLVAEITLVAASIGGLVILRRQGPPAGGTDWYPSAAPVLVAIPVAVVVVRGYPYLVSLLSRLAGRGHGVPAFIGLARAARVSLTSMLPAFALVLALTVIGFGATLRAAVIRGDVATSWRTEGADVVIDASASYAIFIPAAQRAIAAVPGVRRTSALSVLTGAASDGTQLGVVVVNPVSYAALIAQTPLPAFPAAALAGPAGAGTFTAGTLPVLASPTAAPLIGRGRGVLIGSRDLKVRVVGIVSSIAGAPASGQFVVLPFWAMGASQPAPNLLLVVGPDVAAARLQAVVRRVQPAATVTFRSGLLASLGSAPLPHAAQLTFAQGAAAAAAFGAVIVLIMLALGARPRELTLARLFTMGLSPAQARRLVVAEALPSIVAAAAGGTAATLALVPLIGPAIDLSVLTGSQVPVPLRADLGAVGYLAAGLLVVAALALFAQSLTTRLRGVARAMRAGE